MSLLRICCAALLTGGLASVPRAACAQDSTQDDAPATRAQAATPDDLPATSTAATDAELGRRVDTLMDRMVRARTRIAALGEALFKTRVELYVDNRVEDHRLVRVRMYLDGVVVHDSAGEGLAEGQRARLYRGYAAPGMHELAVEIEQINQQDDRYRYTLAQRFRFRAPDDHVTQLHLRLDDDSDIAEDFEDDQDGEYDVRTRLRVQAREIEGR